jgi:septum formation protein
MPPVDLLLASQSPRRQELLQQIGVRFSVIQVQVPEVPNAGESPVDYVARLALDKAKAGSALREDLPVLGADTVVVHRGAILEKPRDRQHALAMLSNLAGDTHRVLTGIAVCRGEKQQVRVVTSEVTFRAIGPEEAERYWNTGEPCDKAGGYGIQGMGAVFVAHLAGSYSNVVGLPLTETQALLAYFQVPVWCGADYE